MQPFHIIVRGLPREEVASDTASILGSDLQTLVVPPHLQATQMEVSFEEAAASLETLPRMYFEPDGSFVWVSAQDAQPKWQIEGNLFDRSGRLVSVDLKGSCPRRELQRLLTAFRKERSPLMFEIVKYAVFLCEDEFWRLFSSGKRADANHDEEPRAR